MNRYNSIDSPARGTVAQVLAQARASLKEPSRPFTPAETRHEYESRPSSVQENRKMWSNFDPEVNRRSRKLPRDTHVRPGSIETTLSSRSEDGQIPPSDQRPAWIREIDEIIAKLDRVMTDISDEAKDSSGIVLVRDLLYRLWPCVESMAGACSDGDERWVLQRNRLFAALFRVLERKESDLRLYAARCVLSLLGAGRASMSVSLQLPKYETAVCKVLFQLTKVSQNDDAFFEVGVVEPMISLLEAQAHQLNHKSSIDLRVIVPVEAPVFLVGALKNISSSEVAQSRLGKLGAVSVLCSLLRHSLSYSEHGEAQDGPAEYRAQLLIHVTGALRNLSIAKAHHKQLASCGAPSLLCELVGERVHETELMFNITRILAKVSLHETLRAGINSDTKNVLNLAHLLNVTAKKVISPIGSSSSSQLYALLVRISFTLGNLTASNERNRVLIGTCSTGEELVELVQVVLVKYENMERANETNVADLEELLVKLIRLLANLSISSEIGPVLSALPGVSVLVPLLEMASKRSEQEELLLNVVSAVTNLSFYYQPGDESDHLLSDHSRLCSILVEILLHENPEAVTEAARAFGNISRNIEVRGCMCRCGAGEALVILLDHSSRDVVFAASGALVNIAADAACNGCLTSFQGASFNGCCKLVHILRQAGLKDLLMASVATKALYNLFASFRSEYKLIENALGTQLEVLHQSLDEMLDAVGEDGGGFTRAASALFALLTTVLQEGEVYEDLPFDSAETRQNRK